MADPTSSPEFTLTLSPTFNIGLLTETEDWAISALVPLEGKAVWGKDNDVTVTAEASVFANAANTFSDFGNLPPYTILRGAEDRYTFFMSRNPVAAVWNNALGLEHPFVGVKRLGGSVAFNSFFGTPTVTAALFKPIEDILYPYNHNSFGGLPTLQSALFDTAAPADIYNLMIGPVLAATWTPISDDQNTLEAAAVMSTAGVDSPFDFSTWMEAAQLKYTHSWGEKEGGDTHPNTLTGALYLTNKSPADRTTATGEEVSDILGIGTSLMLTLPGWAFNAAYSTNATDMTGPGVSISNRYHGLNLSAHKDFGSLVLAGGYSLLTFNEETKAFINTSESTTEHAFDFKALLPITPEFGLTAGYRATFIDKNNNLDPSGQNIHLFSVGLTYNWNIL